MGKKKVRSDNDASELVILAQFKGHFDEFVTEAGKVVRMILTISMI